MGEMFEKVSDFLNFQVIRMQSAWQRQKERAREVLSSEVGAVEIVVILLLIVVAIVLVVVFRNELKTLITNVFKKMGGAVDTAPTGMDPNANY